MPQALFILNYRLGLFDLTDCSTQRFHVLCQSTPEVNKVALTAWKYFIAPFQIILTFSSWILWYKLWRATRVSLATCVPQFSQLWRAEWGQDMDKVDSRVSYRWNNRNVIMHSSTHLHHREDKSNCILQKALKTVTVSVIKAEFNHTWKISGRPSVTLQNDRVLLEHDPHLIAVHRALWVCLQVSFCERGSLEARPK